MAKLFCIGDKVSIPATGKTGKITGLDFIPGERRADQFEIRLGDGSFVYKKRSELARAR